MQKCPWCDYPFNFFNFSSHFRVTEFFVFFLKKALDVSLNLKTFPCPACGKKIQRENDSKATKLAARRAIFWLFPVPLLAWFFLRNVCHLENGVVWLIVIILVVICQDLFFRIIDYKGQILKKAE